MTYWRNPWVWLPGILFLVLFLVGIIAVKKRWGSSGKNYDSSLDILRNRYAREEITREEFNSIRDDLQ